MCIPRNAPNSLSRLPTEEGHLTVMSMTAVKRAARLPSKSASLPVQSVRSLTSSLAGACHQGVPGTPSDVSHKPRERMAGAGSASAILQDALPLQQGHHLWNRVAEACRVHLLNQFFNFCCGFSCITNINNQPSASTA